MNRRSFFRAIAAGVAALVAPIKKLRDSQGFVPDAVIVPSTTGDLSVRYPDGVAGDLVDFVAFNPDGFVINFGDAPGKKRVAAYWESMPDSNVCIFCDQDHESLLCSQKTDGPPA